MGTGPLYKRLANSISLAPGLLGLRGPADNLCHSLLVIPTIMRYPR